MALLVLSVIAYLRAFLLRRHSLSLEIAVLRQQLAVYKTQTATTPLAQFGPALLDPASPFLVFLGGRANPGIAGHGDFLASRWLSVILAMAITAA